MTPFRRPHLGAAERRNAGLCIVGEALWGFQAALVVPMTVLTLLLRHYGAGPRLIGAVTAIEGGLLVLPQVLGLYWFRNLQHRKRPLVIWHCATVIPAIAANALILLALDGRASPPLICGLLLATYALFVLSVGVIVGVWMDWLATLFHKGIRGTVMGATFFAASFAGTAGGILAGSLLQRAPGPRTYALLYLGAAAIATVAIALFWFIREDGSPAPAAHTPGMRDLLKRFRESLADRNFRRFLFARLLAACGFCVAPFVAVYFQSPAGGALADGTVVLCGTAATLAAALTNIILGRLGDHFGHRLGSVVGAATQTLALLVLLTGHGLWACALAYFGVGVCAGVGVVSHTNMLFETCPHDHRLAHITIGNLALAVPLLAAPLLAGVFAQAFGLRALFAASLLPSLAAVAAVLTLVRDPRDIALQTT